MNIKVFVSKRLSVLLLMCVVSVFSSASGMSGGLESSAEKALESISGRIAGLPDKSPNKAILQGVKDALSNPITAQNIGDVKRHVDAAIAEGCVSAVILMLQAELAYSIENLGNQ